MKLLKKNKISRMPSQCKGPQFVALHKFRDTSVLRSKTKITQVISLKNMFALPSTVPV